MWKIQKRRAAPFGNVHYRSAQAKHYCAHPWIPL
jgi:hypothetical protein